MKAILESEQKLEKELLTANFRAQESERERIASGLHDEINASRS